MNEEKMIKLLKTMIKEKRFEHSIGVMNTANELANIYSCDVQKARIAGLLHDCAKGVEKSEILKLCSDFGIVLDDINSYNIELLHGPLGAEFAKSIFYVDDKEVLDAIKYHTIGKENMCLLTKIIYLADYIEPGRNFKGVDIIREQSKVNLDRALVNSIDSTIKYVLEKGSLLHPNTVEARNYILLHLE